MHKHLPKHIGTVFLILDILFSIGVLAGSLLPANERLLNGNSGLALHFGAYFMMMLLFACYLDSRKYNIYLGGIIIICYGVLIELLQAFTGYRHLDSKDMLANTAGVILGIVAYYCGIIYYTYFYRK